MSQQVQVKIGDNGRGSVEVPHAPQQLERVVCRGQQGYPHVVAADALGLCSRIYVQGADPGDTITVSFDVA